VVLPRIALSLALLPALACSDTAKPSAVAPTEAFSPPPQVSGIILRPANAVLMVRDAYTIFGDVLTSASQAPWEGTITWLSSDTRIADVRSVGRNAATVVGLRPGTVSISASVTGLTVSTTFTVLDPAPSEDVVPVVVDDFHVVEFQYPSNPGQWYYAPLIRLRDTTGVATAAVIRTVFEIPGFEGHSPPCNGVRVLTSTPFDVFREIYGDYELTIDVPGARAASGVATAYITMRIGQSDAIVLKATGPVVPGSLPTTYTGGIGIGC
jgi:hypothetical protein